MLEFVNDFYFFYLMILQEWEKLLNGFLLGFSRRDHLHLFKSTMHEGSITIGLTKAWQGQRRISSNGDQKLRLFWTSQTKVSKRL